MRALIMAILSHGGQLDTQLGVETEATIIEQVAAQRNMNRTETRLLATIRRIENGGAGNEFGVGSGDPAHPAHRKAGDPSASFRLQCEWAAGTIERRFDGNINTFAARWCPVGREQWARNAAFYMAMEVDK